MVPVHLRERCRTRKRYYQNSLNHVAKYPSFGGKLRIGQNSELEITLANVKPMEKNFEALKVMYG